jgi:hypothetical protein
VSRVKRELRQRNTIDGCLFFVVAHENDSSSAGEASAKIGGMQTAVSKWRLLSSDKGNRTLGADALDA